MRKTAGKIVLAVITVLMAASVFSGCAEKTSKEGLWKDAVYSQDQTFGSGKTTVEVEVKAAERSVTFTIRTDRSILGEALIDHELIEGEPGEYGLYVKKVNGITADYNIDQSYWGFYQNGEYMMTGVDMTEITDGAHYELVYEK